MANRMNKVRALTGGLAAIMIMSNMASVTAFAAEPETVAIEQTVEVTQEASEAAADETAEIPAEETAPAATESTENTEEVPAEETTPAEEERTVEIGSEVTAPADDTVTFDVKETEDKRIIGEIPVPDDNGAETSFVTKETNDGIYLDPIVVDPIDISIESVKNDEEKISQYDVEAGIVCNQLSNAPEDAATATAEQVQVAAEPENEATASDVEAIASDTEGIAQAGNIEEPAATDTTGSNIPGVTDEEELQKSAEYQANRILRETTEGKLWNKDTQFWMNNTYYLAEEMTDGYVYVTKVDRNSGDQTVVDVIPTQDLYAEGIHV